MKIPYLKRIIICIFLVIGCINGLNAQTNSAQVAKVGDKEYSSVSRAFSACASGDTVKLIADASLTEVIKVAASKTQTLDLNGCNLDVPNTSSKCFEVNGNLVLIDSKENSTGKIYSSSVNATSLPQISVSGSGTFTLQSGTIESIVTKNGTTVGNNAVYVSKGGSVVVNGGTIKAGSYAIVGDASDVSTSSSITVNGGQLISTTAYAIYAPQNGSIHITGGAVSGHAGGIAIQRGSLSVTGGTIKSEGKTDLSSSPSEATKDLNCAAINFSSAQSSVTATINGGEVVTEGNAKAILSENQTASNTVSIDIIAGTFRGETESIKPYINENSVADESENLCVVYTGDIVLVYKDRTEVIRTGAKNLEFTTTGLTKLLVNADINDANVKMTKNFSTTKWASFYVPFDISITADLLEKFEFANIFDTELVNGATTIEFKILQENETLKANLPCLIRAKNIGENVLELTGTNIKKVDATVWECSTLEQVFTFNGVYENTTLLDKYGYYLNPAKQQFTAVSNASAYVPPTVFYLTIRNKKDGSYDYPSADQPASNSIRFYVNGEEVTSIQGLTIVDEDKEQKVFNLQGLFMGNDLNALPAGLYIVNGKKVMVK